MRPDDLVGVVLAAGDSSRFGTPKQLLPLGETTLLGQVVENVNRSSLQTKVVVLGKEAAKVRQSFEAGAASVIDNLSYGEGCASSLLAGLEAYPDCAGIMLLLGDQPGVKPEIIDRALETWSDHKPWALATSYRGALGHPLAFGRAAFDDLRALHGDKAVWKLIERFPEKVVLVEIDSDLPPDIDTPEDYEAEIARRRA